jgi:hypothetical protein
LPGFDGHALAAADGLSECDPAAPDQYGLEPVHVQDTDHYKAMREFCDDPKGFVEAVFAE